jgi:hypothetical protein
MLLHMHTPDHCEPEGLPERHGEHPTDATRLILRPQEIPLDDPRSRYNFQPSLEKPFPTTAAALDLYGVETILACLYRLQYKARLSGGLDYLQVFSDPDRPEPLWFLDDDEDGAITALLPSDY